MEVILTGDICNLSRVKSSASLVARIKDAFGKSHTISLFVSSMENLLKFAQDKLVMSREVGC